ncbi:MAG: PTS system fructose-specific EIIABC component [Lentisphaerae bacterium ADurb.Bin242]|nr:MAG: PTS system fructose-specific EIIABC component [Lentisphaerae bacterium ADurb.Bin242]
MKPEFVKYLQPESILILDGETKKTALEEIISYATTRCTLDDAQLREAIWKREKMMTTGIGNGLALPHIRVAGFPSPLVIVGLCQNPIADYRTLDNEPVRLIVFLAADEKDQEAYLKILGSISVKLKDKDVMAEILEAAPDKKKIFAILNK